MGDSLQDAINALLAAGKEDEARAVESLRATHQQTMRQYDAGQRASYEAGRRDAAPAAAPVEALPPLPEPPAHLELTAEERIVWRHGYSAAITADRAARTQAAEAVAPAVLESSEEEAYLIQDSRSYVGNSVLWWGPDYRGYTTNVNEAGRYTRDQAYRQHAQRSSDRPWSEAKVLLHALPRVDWQDLRESGAMSIVGGSDDAARGSR